MPVHVSHAEYRVETGVGICECVLERSVVPEEFLQPGVPQRVIHLAGMEMNLYLGIIEQVNLCFLVKNIRKGIAGLVERLYNAPVRPFHPKINIAAQASLGYGVETTQPGALKYAAHQPHPLQKRLKLLYAFLMAPVDSGRKFREFLPLVH